MEKIRQLDNHLHLYIGTFDIQIIHIPMEEESFNLPEKARPFLVKNPGFSRSKEIEYFIDLEDSFMEPISEPVAGFDDGPFPYRIYSEPSGDFLWIRKNKFGEIQLAYRIAEDWGIWRLVADNSGTVGSNSFAELAYIFAYSVLPWNGIVFHGVVMEWQGMGIIVCAHSGVGKSTHTRMWRDNENARILNGDRALCCKEGDQWFAYGAPWCGSSEEYCNRKVPLMAVVILEQAEFNEVKVIAPLKGAMELIQLAFAPAWDANSMNLTLDTIDNIVQKIPVLKLRCKPDMEAVAVLKTEISRIYNK